MLRRKRVLPTFEGVEIIDVAAEGNSIAKVDEMVVFVPYGAPGDIIDLKIDKKKKSFAQGHIQRMVKPSEIRVEPMCEHFGICGGCKWQHIPYDYQLKYKHKQVVDALERIAKVELPEITPILGSKNTCEYRNKLEFTFSNKSWLTFEQMRSEEVFDDRDALGFHIPGAFDKVLDVKKCWLQENVSNEIRLFIRAFAKENNLSFYDIKQQVGLMRNIIVRTASTGEIMLIVVFGDNQEDNINNMMNAIAERYPQITALLYVINKKVNDTISDQEILTFKGADYIEEEMEGLRFRIGPKSFYQTNSAQAYELYKITREFAELSGDELVYDLYTGTGTIANFVAKNARKVIGIEYVPDAIEDAKINASVNGLDNTEFFAGDMKDILTDSFVAEYGVPDVMIIDPPRAGMHTDVVNVILNAAPKRIVYVSCNPATQARDLALMDAQYKLVKVQPVDMFPHTHHVENVVALELR
ncbi:MAG: 23S rRNA (uracil(1939)-C(5))-methyltransferase RlmD [Bacteroidales bacterium]